jgi:lipid II:glycine glycyltransferase (peptidoglycan interpeptide bridge formation enzyme)
VGCLPCQGASGPYQQSSLWAKVKAGQGWRSARMTVTRVGWIHAGAQSLYRAIPLAGAVGFVARGPILASDDPALAATAAEGLQRLAAACNVIYLIVQPTRGAWRSWRPIYSGTGTGPRPRSWRHTTPRRVYWT